MGVFYRWFGRPLLKFQDSERAHLRSLKLLRLFSNNPLTRSGLRLAYKPRKSVPVEVFGHVYSHPFGLAAGMDKNAIALRGWESTGLAFIEIGGVTQHRQDGNPKPRMFRADATQALVNRMGFNNIGVNKVVERLNYNKGVIVGGNIGKNKITDFNNSIQDYLICFEKLYPHVNYFAINVSSPNTEKLRDLQQKDLLKNLLEAIQKKNKSYSFPKPVLLKIGPDLSQDQLIDVIEVIAETSLDGIIATNTTLSRDNLTSSKDLVNQKGGLSGRPISEKSTNIIKFIHEKSNGSIPIIGVGGIMNPDDAIEKIKAGASLIQIYSGFVYSGPSIVKKINKAIIDYRLNQ